MEMEIISFKINECGFNDTSTWPAWLFFGDDHVIWMRPVVTSSKVNSFPWLLFCKSSFVINRLKYACVCNYHDHTRRQLMLVASLILTKREGRHRSALKIDQEDLYRNGDSMMAVAHAFEERAVELGHNNLLSWLMCQQDTQNRRASERKAEEVYRA